MEITFSLLYEHIVVTAYNAVKTYFLPLQGWRAIANELRQSPLIKPNSNLLVPLSLVALLRDVVCKNQGMLSEYWYQSAELHKELRIAFTPPRKNRSEIKELASNLVKELNANLFKATKANFNLLHEVFEGRDKIQPRICIKGYFKTEKEGQIITVFRDRVASDHHKTPEGSNTGFDYVVENGTYYLCNDLPKAAFQGRYINPRLNVKKIENKTNRWAGLGRQNWDLYWLDQTKDSHYKSTLIIPMTFWNNHFESNFIRALDVFPNSKRTIFGFLCLDHVRSNFFNEELDVSVGYMYADFISMYLFARAVFIEISKTFEKVEKYLNAPEFDAEFEEILTKINELISKQHHMRSVREIDRSSKEENFLWKFDSELLKFASTCHNFEAAEANKAINHDRKRPVV